MTSKVKELVEAAKRAQVLLRAVTVGQVLEEGHAAIEAAGINPYCVNEGRADGSESIGTWWLESAISAVESEGDGWIEIKDGCEMPPTDGRFVLFCRIAGYISYAPTSARYGTYHPNAKGRPTWRNASGVKIDFTHWQPLPAPPTKEAR